jgi:hypothetical protein
VATQLAQVIPVIGRITVLFSAMISFFQIYS